MTTANSNDASRRIQPLINGLKQLEPHFVDGITEYQLITILQKPPYAFFDADALGDPLTLFQCHFMLFHALYQLQAQWSSAKKGLLDIYTTNIQLRPFVTGEDGLTKSDPLRSYYLDWQHFSQTQKEDVDELIHRFWLRMGQKSELYSTDEYAKACEVFGIDGHASMTKLQLKKHYHRLQHQCHPDKGGEKSCSSILSWAYKVLRAFL
ncbi:DNA-J related domain-containing protein [Alteromonas sp. 14N.309.X.WAT.G.H12]|uniref:DNA-J related domain-containing protein n=1 Tax=Alteromonas sp. 14N.309.X.WAT.G.H12 TaxID=3120824 RepID=UPI002FD60CF2